MLHVRDTLDQSIIDFTRKYEQSFGVFCFSPKTALIYKHIKGLFPSMTYSKLVRHLYRLVKEGRLGVYLDIISGKGNAAMKLARIMLSHIDFERLSKTANLKIEL